MIANPVGESVVSGQATFDRQGNQLTVNQSTDRVLINWQDFSIGADEVTRFVQPGSHSLAVNRVVSGNLSSIMGRLEANGRVWLINPNGVVIGSGAHIDTNGFLATTLDATNEALMRGEDVLFSGNSEATIHQMGTIDGGSGDVYLLSRQIIQEGTIKGQTVGLAAGTEILLQEQGAEHLFVKAGEVTQGTGIAHRGKIEAIQAELKAAGGSIYSLAIDAGGMIEANQVQKVGGKVFLRAEGATVKIRGKIKAAQEVLVEGLEIGVLKGGEIASKFVKIGGGKQGKSTDLQNARKVFVAEGAKILGEEEAIVWSDGSTGFYGEIETLGGFAEVSGKEYLDYQGTATLHGGTLLLDPRNLTIATTQPGSTTARTLATDLDQFSDFSSENSYLSVSQLLTLLSSGNVTLQANTDITFSNSLNASAGAYLNRSLTLNAGRSITFANNVALTLNGGNFTATINDAAAVAAQRTAGAAQFSMGNATSITTNGGNITMNAGSFGGSASGRFLLGGTTSGAQLNTNGGNINITGVGSSTANLTGILIRKSSVLSSASGHVNVTGTGFSAAVANSRGIQLESGAKIQTTSGNITLNGTGGVGSNSNIGVLLTGAGTEVKTQTGAITLTGTGKGTGTSNHGVNINSGALVDATGGGSIQITGAASTTGTSGNIGVVVNTSSARVRTSTGSIQIQGTGGGTTTGNQGVNVSGTGIIESISSGTILITGTASNTGTGSGAGVVVTGANSRISGGSGTVQITGNGRGGGTNNRGIQVDTAGVISASGGTLNLTGTGSASGTSGNQGILVSGTNSRISTTSGAMTLDGTGGGTTTGNQGILISSGSARLESTAGGDLSLTGRGSSTGTGGGTGVYLSAGRVNSTTGAVTISGTGRGAGTDARGFQMDNSSINLNGSAALTVTGLGNANSAGIFNNTASNVIGGASATGDVTLIAGGSGAADYIQISNTSIRTIGKVNLEPLDASTTIGIGNSSVGKFNLNSTDIAAIISGNSGLRIGKNNGTGAVNIRAQSFNTDLTVLSAGSGSGGITVNGVVTQTANKNIVLATAGNFQNTAGANALGVSGSGKYYVYAPDEANVTKGGLTANKLYNGTFSTLAPSSITQSGSRFVYATPATLTVTAQNVAMNLGETPTLSYTISGLRPGDTAPLSFSGNPSLQLQTTFNGGSVVVSQGTLSSPLNYKFNFVNGNVQILNSRSSGNNLNSELISREFFRPMQQIASVPRPVLESKTVASSNNSGGGNDDSGDSTQFAILGEREGYDQVTDRMIDLNNLSNEESELIGQIGKEKAPEANRVLNRALNFADEIL